MSEQAKLMQQLYGTNDPKKLEALATRIVNLPEDPSEPPAEVPETMSPGEVAKEGAVGLGKGLRGMLATTGEMGKDFGEGMAAPGGWAAEQFLKTPMGAAANLGAQGIMAVAQKIKETGTYQDIASFVSQYPETVDFFKDVVNTAELFPAMFGATKGWKTLANTSTDNLATRLDGTDIYGTKKAGSFYEGDPLGAIKAGWSPKDAGLDMIVPKRIANREAKGTGQHRVNEAVETGTKNMGHLVGNMRASKAMRNQADKKLKSDNLIEDMPLANNAKGVVRGGDDQGFRELMLSELPDGHEIPENIATKFVDTDRARLGGRSGAEGKLAAAFQGGAGVPQAKDAIAVVTDPNISYNDLAREVSGINATGGQVGKAAAKPAQLRNAGKYMGDYNDWSPEQWVDYYKTAAATERASWFGKEKLLKALPKGKVGKWLTSKLVGNMDEGVKSRVGRSGSQSTVLNAYWGAKEAVRKFEAGETKTKPTASQTQLIDVIDDVKAKQHPNLVKYDKENNTIDYVGSFLSTEQQLGGVGYRLSHDLNKNNIYTNGIDGHDLHGVDPVGGDQLWTFSPVMVNKPGKVDKKQYEKYKDKKMTPEQEKKIVDRTGIERNKGETDGAYQLRVLKDWQAPVKAKHYAQPAVAGGMLTQTITGQQEDEQ